MPVSPHRKKMIVMRAIGEWIDYHREQEHRLRPRTGEVAVGSADFDHLLKATVGEAFLRSLRQGETPVVARIKAAEEGDQCVAIWNSRTCFNRACMSGKFELQRWNKAGTAEADAVYLVYVNMMRP